MSALRIARPGYVTELIDQGPAVGRVSFTRGPVAPIGGLLVVAPSEATRNRQVQRAFRLKGEAADRDASERAQEVLRIVHKHHGNRAAASRELGVSESAVSRCMRRLVLKGYTVPEWTR
jgi:uncharacterized membrane protein